MSAIRVVAGSGIDTVYTSLAVYSLAGTNIEYLTGISNAGQSLTGNEVHNIIYGASGADTLDGAGGEDSWTAGRARTR